MTIDIVPIRADRIDGLHAVLDEMCWEHIYLAFFYPAFLEAPPIQATRAFLRGNMAKGSPQLVAIDEEHVVGWCDVNPVQRPTMRHGDVLGIGLLGEFRGRGLGEKRC